MQTLILLGLHNNLVFLFVEMNTQGSRANAVASVETGQKLAVTSINLQLILSIILYLHCFFSGVSFFFYFEIVFGGSSILGSLARLHVLNFLIITLALGCSFVVLKALSKFGANATDVVNMVRACRP